MSLCTIDFLEKRDFLPLSSHQRGYVDFEKSPPETRALMRPKSNASASASMGKIQAWTIDASLLLRVVAVA